VRYTRILVPLDGSPRAESALPLATRVARKHGAELVLVHVVPVPELTRVYPLATEDVELEQKLIERNERVGRLYIDQLRAQVSERGLRVGAVLTRGRDIRSELLRITSESQADLVVVAAHGRSGRTERPLGSVSGHLAEHCTTPLLIVRERSRRTAERPEAPRGRRPAIALTAA
jgi:nucleotide-binding universal stress UspA family protein